MRGHTQSRLKKEQMEEKSDCEKLEEANLGQSLHKILKNRVANVFNKLFLSAKYLYS